MQILLIEPDKATRDQIQVGLECFPDIQVDWAEGFTAINRARQKSYDFIMISHHPGVHDGLADLNTLREFDRETNVVLITSPKLAKQIAADRTKLLIYSTLASPVEVREFFRLVARMRERAAQATKA